ncbi:BBSome-interacting protein 1 [Caenorhabditis elegans]|uniref:BBSome-interacting protein 1 n=1 Tax=Caenorhabditis elegans TaxID=6239 RepID=Q21273_CAEEL|nr:BBSome-interacting protein 1 [Caenorhabditis elegans]CCD64765.1 BBSome-interacting protein 1 [Caenorhabditis elegans]|eukprot:NP_505121.2 Uncharacterized protein CELE_K07C11.10 [Caenorhabditis elegans]
MDLVTFLNGGVDEGEVAPATEKNEKQERVVMSQGEKLEEKLFVDECYLFQDETLTPIFCKPKLIPLKTITTQKLEKMQREQMERLQVPEGQKARTPESAEAESPKSNEGPSTSEPKEADVWTADD